MQGQEVRSKLDGILYTGNDKFFSSQYSVNYGEPSFRPFQFGLNAPGSSHRPNT